MQRLPCPHEEGIDYPENERLALPPDHTRPSSGTKLTSVSRTLHA